MTTQSSTTELFGFAAKTQFWKMSPCIEELVRNRQLYTLQLVASVLPLATAAGNVQL